MRQKKIILGILAAVVVVVAVIGVGTLGKRGSGMQGPNTTAPSANTLTIKDYMFTPATVKVKVGTKVTWTNQDEVNHTVTADNPSSAAPSSMDIAKGQSYSFTFTKPGTYAYHCFPHPYMHGTVEVTSS